MCGPANMYGSNPPVPLTLEAKCTHGRGHIFLRMRIETSVFAAACQQTPPAQTNTWKRLSRHAVIEDKCPARPPQVAALERGPADGREGAAWTASSLAADPANIGAFVQADAVPRLLQMLKTGALFAQRRCATRPLTVLTDPCLRRHCSNSGQLVSRHSNCSQQHETRSAVGPSYVVLQLTLRLRAFSVLLRHLSLQHQGGNDRKRSILCRKDAGPRLGAARAGLRRPRRRRRQRRHDRRCRPGGDGMTSKP